MTAARRGFSLVEVMIASVLMIIVIIGIMDVVDLILRTNEMLGDARVGSLNALSIAEEISAVAVVGRF
ncbi:MAG: prepilin-type N-terminal cleavage/methylation domain-containing protein [Synergistaceae bacterium]|jgi:Tfp pilus assembly protein PilV|nr:prepilin-type N-terminal cleavage/methylation domain-containing protein [Synergistaceae bacterium]